MDLREAIAKGMLCPPKILLAGYDELLETDDPLAQLRADVGDDTCSPADAAQLLALLDALAVQSPAAGLGVPPRRKVIAFCRTLKEAEQLAARLTAYAAATGTAMNALYLSGTMSMTDRLLVMEDLEMSKLTTVICCARALQEGVDAPWCDTVAFMSTFSSTQLLTQMIGRAIRLHAGKARAHIIVPVQCNAPEPVVALVAGWACVDSMLAELVSKLGAAAHGGEAARALAAGIAALTAELFEYTGAGALDDVLEAVRGLRSSWFDRDVCDALMTHLARTPGDTALCKVKRSTKEGKALFNLRAALARVGFVRTLLTAGELARVQVVEAILEGLDVDWMYAQVQTRKQWMDSFEAFKLYKEKHGSVNIPRTSKTAPQPELIQALYNWAGHQRRYDRKGTLLTERYNLLDTIGFWSKEIQSAGKQ